MSDRSSLSGSWSGFQARTLLVGTSAAGVVAALLTAVLAVVLAVVLTGGGAAGGSAR